MNETPTFSWFGEETMGGSQRVSIYSDGTVEIQHGDLSFRAVPAEWVLAAAAANKAIERPGGGNIVV